jgi:hypothetical protein
MTIELISKETAASIAGCCCKTLDRAIQRSGDTLVPTRIGTRVLFSRQDLEFWLANRRDPRGGRPRKQACRSDQTT